MLKVKYNIGDFVNIPYSRKPSLIIKIIDNVDYNNTSVDNISNSVNALLSIDEYNGDYLIMKVSDIISVATIDNYGHLIREIIYYYSI
jgi:hypothetical protein